MANNHGGYRKPSNPAAFSGQGKYSKRTDGGPADMLKKQPVRPMAADGVYGARKASQDAQAAAPMSAGVSTPKLPPVTSLFNETTRPDEPVTAGNPLGAGPGPEVLDLPNARPSLTSTLRRLAQVDESGEIETILSMLSRRGIN
jgi:hypothetical protein